ncbi:MAG: hypothetical protein [Caudoviricetes sp.]|nr:MAG: hypothetical protein [Caudoviricetes sp.]
MIEVTVVFRSDYHATIHFKVSTSLSIGEIHQLVSKRYTGVAYVAVGINN